MPIKTRQSFRPGRDILHAMTIRWGGGFAARRQKRVISSGSGVNHRNSNAFFSRKKSGPCPVSWLGFRQRCKLRTAPLWAAILKTADEQADTFPSNRLVLCFV